MLFCRLIAMCSLGWVSRSEFQGRTFRGLFSFNFFGGCQPAIASSASASRSDLAGAGDNDNDAGTAAVLTDEARSSKQLRQDAGAAQQPGLDFGQAHYTTRSRGLAPNRASEPAQDCRRTSCRFDRVGWFFIEFGQKCLGTAVERLLSDQISGLSERLDRTERAYKTLSQNVVVIPSSAGRFRQPLAGSFTQLP